MGNCILGRDWVAVVRIIEVTALWIKQYIVYVRWAFGTSNTGRITVGDRLNEVTVGWGSTVLRIKKAHFMYRTVHVKTNAYAGLEQFKCCTSHIQCVVQCIQQWTIYGTVRYWSNARYMYKAHAFKTHSFPELKLLISSAERACFQR